MSQYKGKTVRVEASAQQISDKFADLSKMSQYIDRLPEDQLSKIGDLRFEPQAIIIKNPTVGEMAFKIVERTPQKIVFAADGLLPLSLSTDLKPVGNEQVTDITTTLDIEIPMMLRPMIGGKLQQVADMFGDLLGKLVSTTAGQA